MTREPCSTSWQKCPSCGGKGHIMDAGCLLIPIVGWVLAWGERNDRNGLSRDTCGQCRGKGFVRP
jgi:hypothetical protein